MVNDVDIAVREGFLLLMPELVSAELDPGVDMVAGYGLTSLNKVLFLMSLCEALGVDVGTLSEVDLAGMRTLADVATAMGARRSVREVAT